MSFKHLTIPSWVRWIAQDANGNWWGYSVEPLAHDQGWYENEVGDCVLLRRDPPNAGWQETLQAIELIERQK
jgi:hypothetical protein